MRCYCAFDAPGCNGSRCMLTTLMTGRRPVCTADPTMGVLETPPGVYRLTPIPGVVNRTCQATTTAAAARTTVETTCRTRRTGGGVHGGNDPGFCGVRLRRW